jgi:hypothetical protein
MTTQNKTFFQPHIWLKVERDVPCPIFVIGLTGRTRWLQIPLPDACKPENVHQYFRQHYQNLHILNTQRIVTCYGECLGYYYHYAPRRTIEYDVNGNEIDRHDSYPPHYLAKAEIMSMDGTPLPIKIVDVTDPNPPE